MARRIEAATPIYVVDTVAGTSELLGATLDELTTQVETLDPVTNTIGSFTFRSTTTDADPGAGNLRLGSATQNASVVLRLDNTSAAGADVAALIADMASGSPTVKGELTIKRSSDATKFIKANVTAVASPTGYKNVTIAVLASSSTSPFADGDAVDVSFRRAPEPGPIASQAEAEAGSDDTKRMTPLKSKQALAALLASTMLIASIGSTARSMADWFGDILNVKSFGATGDGVTDDSAAIAAAINKGNTDLAVGKPVVIYFPFGRYVVDATALPRMTRPISLIGPGGPMKAIIMPSTSYAGDLFAWQEVWLANAWGASTIDLGSNSSTTNKAGVIIDGISVVGSRAATSQQNAFTFYDRADLVHIVDVEVHYIKGRALSVGRLSSTTQAYMRESRIDRFRSYSCGLSGVPVVEITCRGAGDSSNEINIGEMDIYSPYGDGFVIDNDNSAKNVFDIRINKLRVEGGYQLAGAGDLVRLGSASLAGAVSGIYINQLSLIGPYTGYSAMLVTAASAALQPYYIDVAQGYIGAGSTGGKGLNIQAGRICNYKFAGIASVDTNLTVGASPLVGAGNIIDGGGLEQSWTTNIDSSVARLFGRPSVRRIGYTGAIQADIADSTAVGGNTRGFYAVDLQMAHSAAAQVASGSRAVIGGGENNTNSGSYSTIPGGFAHVATGDNNHLSGKQANDRGRQGVSAFASSARAAAGDNQMVQQGLRGSTSSTSAVRLTADAAAASSTNTVNIPNSTAYAVKVSVTAFDSTAPANALTYFVRGVLTRGASAAATTWAAGSPETVTAGTTTGASVSVSADTTNGALNVSFTPPTGNAVAWRALAKVETVEVQ